MVTKAKSHATKPIATEPEPTPEPAPQADPPPQPTPEPAPKVIKWEKRDESLIKLCRGLLAHASTPDEFRPQLLDILQKLGAARL